MNQVKVLAFGWMYVHMYACMCVCVNACMCMRTYMVVLPLLLTSSTSKITNVIQETASELVFDNKKKNKQKKKKKKKKKK